LLVTGFDSVGGHRIDDPVALNGRLADIVALTGFGHAPPDYPRRGMSVPWKARTKDVKRLADCSRKVER